jgi:hypothetical protein
MDMQRVDSSNIESVGYDPDTAQLHVRFTNGSLYQYENVPPDVHQDLMASSSIGTQLHQVVKGQYPHTRLE